MSKNTQNVKPNTNSNVTKADTTDVDDILDELVQAKRGGGGGSTTGIVERNAAEGFATLTKTTRPEVKNKVKTGRTLTVYVLHQAHLMDERLRAKMGYVLNERELEAVENGEGYVEALVHDDGTTEARRHERTGHPDDAGKPSNDVYDNYEKLIAAGALERFKVRQA